MDTVVTSPPEHTTIANQWQPASEPRAIPPKASEDFQRLYKQIARRGIVDVPALRGSYEEWKVWMAAAVEGDYPPSREIILANEQLAAWEAVKGIYRVSSFPVTVSVALTEVCNARCSFCAYVPERVATERVTLADVQRADWLKFCKTFTPNGGGLGEPFAHPEFVEILEALRIIAPFIKFSIISNGSLLRPEAVRAVTGFVDCIKVSLNASTQATYEQTMAPLIWSKTLDNVRSVRDEKIRQGTHLPLLREGYVLHRRNLDELPEFPALVHDLGCEALLVNVMYPPLPIPNRKLMTAEDTIFQEPEKAAVKIAAMEAEAKRLGLKLVKRLPVF